ncbi:hypothetical protein DSO57_1025402 [Entomophthora muscae]|uniref:Uncharacterized protein n=1 Tax=Entomophthora muscae TaxID=34485 RepID=A0ACC2RTE4_9FUNG|nr:hypothetical protein DSO57_1025402 [Entomophthora muscae]
MVFNKNNNNNIIDGVSEQGASKTASMEVWLSMQGLCLTEIFDVGNEEAVQYLTPNSYGFDLFESHQHTGLGSYPLCETRKAQLKAILDAPCSLTLNNVVVVVFVKNRCKKLGKKSQKWRFKIL